MPENDDLPWWAQALVVAFGAAFAVGVVWLASELAEVLDFATQKDLSPDVQKQLKGHNVVVLGPSQSGKTALLWYMEQGKPFKTYGGQKAGPDRTVGTVIVGQEFKINKDKWARVAKDVSGESPEFWRTLMEEVRPSGIIYMVDPLGGQMRPQDLSVLQANVDKEIESMISRVFEVCKTTSISPKAFHVFLNFADIWNAGSGLSDDLWLHTVAALKKRLKQYGGFDSTKITVSITQLSQKASNWTETQTAIDRFGAELGLA